MGNSPSTGHGSEETHVATMEVRKTGERPTEDQSRNCIETKSDSNEDPKQKPPHTVHIGVLIRIYNLPCLWNSLPDELRNSDSFNSLKGSKILFSSAARLYYY